jgi:hypothetical protein
MQPESRGGQKLLRVLSPSEPWTETKKGSITGFYNVIASLSWWMEALKTDVQRTEFVSMLADVHWVLQQMVGTHGGATKRRLEADKENDAEFESPKRCVFATIFDL